jgi:hypothetical protein
MERENWRGAVDHEMKAKSGKYDVEGFSTSATIERGAESWQFFAFIFAATLAFLLSLIDSVVAIVGSVHSPAYGLAAKMLFGAADAYLLLFSPRIRNAQVRWLGQWKKENH